MKSPLRHIWFAGILSAAIAAWSSPCHRALLAQEVGSTETPTPAPVPSPTEGAASDDNTAPTPEAPAPTPEAPAPAGQETPPGGIGTPPTAKPPTVKPPAEQPTTTQPPTTKPPLGQPPARPPSGRAPAGQPEAPTAGEPGDKKAQRIVPKSPDYKNERVDIAVGEIEVLEFLRFLADYTGLNVIIDSTNPQLAQQKILIVAPMKAVTAEIVIALLQANKFLVTRQVLPGGEEVLNVISQAGPVQANAEPVENPLLRVDGARVEEVPDKLTPEATKVRPDEIATMIFTLKYTQPADAIQSLNNLIGGQKAAVKTQAFSIVDVKNSMLVIITAKFGLLNYLAKLLSIIDVPVKEPERILQLIDIENADAEEMVQLIMTFLQGRGGSTGRSGGMRGGIPGAQPAGQPGQAVPGGVGRSSTGEHQTNLMADWRTQKIIVETYDERDLEDIHLLIRELDARFDIRRLKTRIYQVRYLKADEVAADLQTLLGSAGGGLSGRSGLGSRGGGLPGAGGRTGAGAGAGGRTSRTGGGIGRVGRPPGAGAGSPTGIPGQAGGGQNAQIPALIVPHVQTNSLIIQAEPEEYAEILNILEQIDIKRRQVFLEAALVQVTTGSDLNYTIELLAGEPSDTATRALFESSFGLSGIDISTFNRVIPDLSTNVPAGALLAVMNRGKFPALVKFFKSNTDTEVLATPFILADDNQANIIDITETRYVQNTSQGANQVASVTNEGEDAGITLQITPTISSQSAVFLDMSLVVSSFQGGGTTSVLPPKESNSVTSAVTIPDGEIFVIGGLTRENKSKSVSKVPILGDIPFLGKLFRSEASSKSISNLYIFLRAHVLTHPEFKDGVDLTQQALAKVDAFAPGLNPVSFEKPQVTMPPPKGRNPDDPVRTYTRPVRSKYQEGHESPRGPFEPEQTKSTQTPPSYDNDVERPDRDRAESQSKKAAAPGPRTAPRGTKPPKPAQPAATEEPVGGLDQMPPLTTATPPSTGTTENLNPPALKDTGLQVDPEGDSWLVPLRPKQ